MSPGFILLAATPILIILVAILAFRINTVVAGILAAIAAALLSILIFGGDISLVLVAIEKGLSLSLFVLLIIWTSLFLYNLMKSLGLIEVIASSASRITVSRLGQGLLLGWTFAGFIEGIAGFGVPAAILAPLLMVLGFAPITSVVTVLVGHSWAVTFGGMAGAYYTIQLATGLPADQIGPVMGVLFILPIIVTGLMVAHIEGGWPSLKRAWPAVLIIGLTMAVFVWLMIFLNAPQLSAITAGLAGSVCLWMLSKTALFERNSLSPKLSTSLSQEPVISFHYAFVPYYLLIFLALLLQLPIIKQATTHLYLAFNFPGAQTSLGYVVPPVKDYAKIMLFGHPAPILAISILSTAFLFRHFKPGRKEIMVSTLITTVRQTWQPSLSIISMVIMALIMNDSGMTNAIAVSLAQLAGSAFPIISPFLGVLGTFMTGSNASSNVMFGPLQVNVASFLGISPSIIASAQSIGGSLGAAIAPAKVLLGASAVGLLGGESLIMRKTILYCLLVALLVGLECFIAVRIL